MDNILNQIYSDVIIGKQKEVVQDVRTAIKKGISPASILNDGMIAAMREVGHLFEIGDYYVPEMLVSARAMQSGMNILKPLLPSSQAHPAGKVAIGTVKGDFHDIGKNLVKMMLEGAGFEVIDLGVDVDPDEFLDAARSHDVDIIAMSALTTTTMPAMKPVIDELEKSGLRQKVIVIIGGAPLTPEYADQIGADGYAPDASRAAAISKSLLSKSKQK